MTDVLLILIGVVAVGCLLLAAAVSLGMRRTDQLLHEAREELWRARKGMDWVRWLMKKDGKR